MLMCSYHHAMFDNYYFISTGSLMLVGVHCPYLLFSLSSLIHHRSSRPNALSQSITLNIKTWSCTMVMQSTSIQVICICHSTFSMKCVSVGGGHSALINQYCSLSNGKHGYFVPPTITSTIITAMSSMMMVMLPLDSNNATERDALLSDMQMPPPISVILNLTISIQMTITPFLLTPPLDYIRRHSR